jgi:uncharacterized protein (TIGR02391 family)
MASAFSKFEAIARKVNKYTVSKVKDSANEELHPFEQRNIHSDIDKITRKLFDDGHYSQATFEAFKFIDKKVQMLSANNNSGYKLMSQAFSETSPQIKLTNLSNTSEVDEQQGYKFIFSGSVLAIRNPRGHEVSLPETPDQCLDHISLASMLLRRLRDVK